MTLNEIDRMSLRDIDEMQQSAQRGMALLRAQLDWEEVREALVGFLLVMPDAVDAWREVVGYLEGIIAEATCG